MPTEHFQDVSTWVFDLDNTLYPPEQGLFDQIEVLMTDWVRETLGVDHAEADRLRRDYWERYGTTLAGLMAEHDMDPAPYLLAVHDISFEPLVADRTLAERIARLPGRRIVYTNATVAYAEKVLDARGLSGVFDALYGVEEAAFHPKPRREAFETVFALEGFDPAAAAMFEDDPRNLEVPHALGMRTVHVAGARLEAPHIHHHTADLSDFLSQLARLAPQSAGDTG